MQKIKHFLSEVTAIVTLIAGVVTILAVIAWFFKAPDALLFLMYSAPIFIIGALLLTFVIKDGWLRVFGEATSGIFQWPF
jgi:ABC-type dipeptide/oligopeptide/nickel transport system permease component